MIVRRVAEIIDPTIVIEGAGVRLHRSFGPSCDNLLDPFLLFDHFAFYDPIEGPFVMNTEEEIRQALADLRNGTFAQDEYISQIYPSEGSLPG